MAVLDPNGEAVVIRIAYDGAPMAGKTTSVVALGRSLGAGVESPAEVGGRTLYFDWLDYTGGLFEGRRIRCQVISVPGQASLAPRRRRLLEAADAIVFVGDSTPAGFHADRSYLNGLTRVLEGVPGPPVGIVLQANKRDHADAVPLERIRELLDGLGMRIGIVESVATQGEGVREAFVFAVRLALDRVRELVRTGQIQTCKPSANCAEDLLNELKRVEGGALDAAVTPQGLVHTRLADLQQAPGNEMSRVFAQVLGENDVTAITQRNESIAVNEAREPAAPDATVASGFVWPPVDGRIILHELSGAPVRLARNARGDWLGVAGGRWRLISPADAVYDDIEAGRTVLVNSARSHAARQGRVADRCVVLAADGAGRHRLWNISPADSAVTNVAVGSDFVAD
jgi:hypothetical protein